MTIISRDLILDGPVEPIPEAAKPKKYHSVNSQWPDGTNDGRKLKPTPQEAVAAARRLYRFAMKRPWRGKVKLVTGNRRTWVRYGVLNVNPDEGGGPLKGWLRQDGKPVIRSGGGWHELVHGLSHYCTWKLHPGAKPHGMQHAFLEKEMIRHVVESGWLDGKLKRPEKPQPDRQKRRYENALVKLEAWRRKAKRAHNAIKKLERQKRYYEKTLSI